jgi:acyl-CoA thioesterase
MATPFSVLIERAQVDAESLGVDVPEDWMQGRTVFGGLQLALALRAMRALVPGTAVRSLQATFVAPLAGRVVVRARLLRAGKSATQVEARIVDGEATAALVFGVFGVFGAPRDSGVRVAPAPSR